MPSFGRYSRDLLVVEDEERAEATEDIPFGVPRKRTKHSIPPGLRTFLHHLDGASDDEDDVGDDPSSDNDMGVNQPEDVPPPPSPPLSLLLLESVNLPEPGTVPSPPRTPSRILSLSAMTS